MEVITEHKVLPELRFKQYNDNWNTLTLEKLSTINMGQSPESKSYNQLGEGMLLVQGNADIKNRLTNPRQWTNEPTKKCQIGDLILTVRAPVGAIAKSVHNACIGRGVCSISNNSKSDIEFLYQTLVNYEKKWIRLEQGSTFTAVSGKDIRGVKLNIPSLPEQQKIATFLSAVDKKLQQLTKKKDLLEEYKKGVMQQIFSQELRFKDTNGNNYPDWEEKKLGEVANFRRGSFPQPYGLRKWYDDENGFPFVQVFDVADNMLLKSTTKRKISEQAKALSVFVKKGTIVLTIQGSIGRIAITQYDACVDRTLLIFQSFNYPIDIVYFTYIVYLLFDIEKRKAPGGTIKTITKEVLSGFKVKLPILDEQQKIANFLSSLDKKIELVSTQIENTKVFKKGLLQQMFV